VEAQGPIAKMTSRPERPVSYALPVGSESLPLNPRLGETLRLEFEGDISCIHCGRAIKKTFNQGYCYPCFTRLARCDRCIVKPELCHYDRGTCREPEWGRENCLIAHTVYLSVSSGLKVGITRGLDPSTRWIDQGATQGLAIRTVPSRLDSGHVEVALKQYVADRTEWRAMLRGDAATVDLEAERDRLLALREAEHPDDPLSGEPAANAKPVTLVYPVLEYPTRVRSHDFAKQPLLEGSLVGIKGQYLIFDTTVVNVRKYAGYHLRIS